MQEVYDHYTRYGLALLIVGWLVLLVAIFNLPVLYPSLLVSDITTSRQTKTPRIAKPPSVLSGGGQVLLLGHQLVALYGAPGEPVLGALGEQSVDASITRAKQLAAEYQALSKSKVVPTLEIIATVASASPTYNGDYSREVEAASLLPWIHAAQDASVYVVLDLQPGRSDFLSQAKLYANLLRFSNVGLALDPEWRLKPDQVHLTQIGSVDVAEINQVSGWLSHLTIAAKLPQKLLLIHQFRQDMVINRPALDVSHRELAYVIQMDGSGTPQQKRDTWQAIMRDAPAPVSFGWKNFYKQDAPILSAAETMAVTPVPAYVSYQ